MAIGLLSLRLLVLKETHHLHKGQLITATLLMMMVANDTYVMVIIFYLTVLNSNSPITVAMLDVEEMVGVVMDMLE